MADRVTANLPARNFDETISFYARLGFDTVYRDDGWMIMSRGPLEIEFFLHEGLLPHESWFSACLRIADIDSLYATWSSLELPDEGIPRLTAPEPMSSGFMMFALIDPNGSLLRCLSPIAEET